MRNFMFRRRSAALALVLMVTVMIGISGCGGGGNQGAAVESGELSSSASSMPVEQSMQTGKSEGPSASSSSAATSPDGSEASGSSSGEAPPKAAGPSQPASTPAVSDTPSDLSSKPSSTPAASAKPSEPSASPQTGKDGRPPEETSKADVVTISIEGNAEWGTILKAETVVLSKGDTPASVLKRAAKAHRLAFGIRGSGAMTYIEGIDGLFEFDDGPTSGWKYRVNGIVADIGAGAYRLKTGDRLEWYYVSEDAEAEEGKEKKP
ncbi:DUF4430 domain-containing protein [Cohnella soli]|uniref:DUF4430 domain-containing protein n=1 Tax=Cohnella soli TaxID=425005 RepID=A0ABW0HPB2_9BACL